MSNETKHSLSEMGGQQEEVLASKSQFSFEEIISILVLNWQYFLLSLIIFVCGALIYLRYAEPTYQMSARILIKDDQSQRRSSARMLQNMADMAFMSNSTGIDNEIEVLQSRILLRDVVKELKLYTEYRSQGRVMKPIIYGNQPISVDLDPAHLDSLDKAYNEGGMSNRIQMQITRNDEGYMVNGVLKGGGMDSAFARKVKSFPASFKTNVGMVTLTANTSAGKMAKGGKLLATIEPPMVTASRYLSSMSVAPSTKMTDIAVITMTDKNVRRGMDFLRHLTDCYNRQANADKNEIALRTEEFINDRMHKINSELGQTETSIESFKRQNSVTTFNVDATQAVQMSGQYSTRLSEANSQIQMIDYLREYVNNPANRFQIIPSNVGLTDASSVALINSYNQKVQDRNRLLQSVSEQAPQVMTLTSTLEELLQSIQTALMQARRSADIARLGIQSEFTKYQSRISNAPVQERMLTQIGRQQEVHSGLYMLLLQKREENSISLAATADKGKMIDEPLFMGKVSPKSSIILLASIVLGILLPFGIIYLLRLFRYKIEGREDVMDITNLPLIADIPVANESAKTSAGIVVHANKNTQMDEIFRSLRTNVQFMLNEGQKTVLFTSSTAGEGKTFIAANIAVSFALLGKKVILCGLDIRKPALGRLFSITDRKAGLTSLLTHDHVTLETLRQQIQPSGANENLDLLLAGPTPPNPTELLARESFKQVVDLLREQYDYVIFDTAPVGLVTDTLQVARYSDVTVFVCRADYTPKSSFQLLNSLVETGKIENASVVLNGIDMSRRKYGYYYGYGRYGKYARYGYGRYGRYGRYGNYGNYGNYGQYGRYAESHYSNKDDDSIKK